MSQKQILDFGGGRLLKKYSLYDLKCIGFPDYSLFYPISRKPRGYWNNTDNIKEFLDFVKVNFNLHRVNDWNRISLKQIQSIGGSRLFSKYSLFDMLSIAYPNEKWEKSLLSKADKRSSQRWLFLQTQKLFPGEEIIEDYFHNELTRLSGVSIQFDIYIPNKKLALEYHGIQHYEDTASAFAPLEMYKNRDFEKQKLCKNYGIEIIEIPYWWDNDIKSLEQLIFK